jgi:(p)ppGpp synthase/HD superfamily hydrolase
MTYRGEAHDAVKGSHRAQAPPATEPATCLGRRFDQALIYATKIHGQQLRKGTTIPYVSHLLGVCSLVLEDGGNEDQAIAALLHDACEDQGGVERLADIRTKFGERVARIVEGCTDTFESTKPPWRPRKEAYLARLRVEQDPGVIRVSLSDKLHNARALVRDCRQIGDDVWRRFNAGKDDQLWYYRALADIFATLTTSPMASELGELARELESMGRPRAGSSQVE